jgi:hypothetical protein
MPAAKKCKDCVHMSQLHYTLPEMCTRGGGRRSCERERERFSWLKFNSNYCGRSGRFFERKEEQ